MEILIGILCGLVLSLFFSFGPAFFGLIQNSITYGFRKGVAFEVGVNASDIFMVVLMLTLLKNVELGPILHNPWVASIGGTAMIVLGIIMLRRKPTIKREGGRIKFVGIPRGRELVVQGFALNTVNPSVWLYWISLITLISGELDLTIGERYTFFISLLLAELAGGILKCRLASMLQNMVSIRLMTVINRIMGCFLMGVGIFLIASMIVHQRHPEMESKEPAENAAQLIHRIHTMGKDTTSKGGTDTLYLE
ncbi:MAG: LysE family transporter [Bacteroidales bacterium]|nr:LysE family transporter [Bacteroidales bacterium]